MTNDLFYFRNYFKILFFNLNGIELLNDIKRLNTFFFNKHIIERLFYIIKLYKFNLTIALKTFRFPNKLSAYRTIVIFL